MDFFLIYLLVFLIGMLIFLSIFLIIHLTNSSSQLKIQKLTNEQVDLYMLKNGFNFTKTFYLDDNFSSAKEKACKKQVHIDSDNEKLLFVDYATGKIFVTNFKDFINYEIYENGNTNTTGLGLGGLGGGLFSAQTNKTCKELKILIRINDINNAHISYNIISNTALNIGVSKSNRIYSVCIQSLQSFVSFLEVLKNKNKDK